MASQLAGRLSLVSPLYLRPTVLISCINRTFSRSFLAASKPKPSIPDFAFAFDIDGVLLRSSTPLPGASKTLRYLQDYQIPFILLTNGGGKTEARRVSDLSRHLDVPLDVNMFVQSHTPFTQLVEGNERLPRLKDECVLVLGGEGNECREVAEGYGFTNVVTPGDLITAYPGLWPFANRQLYTDSARPIPHKLGRPLKISAILVFHDPRDWALDIQIVVDLLLSEQGVLGTISPRNGDPNLPNHGWQEDGQPMLFFSNPDLWWASDYHLNRLGQGGFRHALIGVLTGIRGYTSREDKPTTKRKVFGKPSIETYNFAENRLLAHRRTLLGEVPASDNILKTVFMVGDNPASDIAGANKYESPSGTTWDSILVKTGVYKSGIPAHEPKVIVPDIMAAVKWALKKSGWDKPFP